MFQGIREVLTWLGGNGVQVTVFPAGDRCVVRSSGLSGMNLPEVEVADCPLYLKDVTSNLVLQIALNGKDVPESLANGKVVGGRFVRADQPLVEVFRLVSAEATPTTLRIRDLEESDGMFPRRLVATHLCATAGALPRDALRLLLVSIEVWPKEATASNAALGDYETNPNNFWSWIDLGTVLLKARQVDEALLKWKTAVCLWPRGGKLYASRMLKRSPTTPGWGTSGPLATVFWSTVTNGQIREWCSMLEVALPDLALAD